MAHSSPTASSPAAAVDLDLAFAADGTFAPGLVEAAGPWADPLAGSEPWQQLLQVWLGDLRRELPPELQASAYSLGLSLVDDAAIAALNAQWRRKEGATDVLAFAAQEDLEDDLAFPMPPGFDPVDNEGEGDDNCDSASVEQADAAVLALEPLELGDIVISLDTAVRQAAEHGHDLPRELCFLASHGLLHLLGWDHPDPVSLAAMLARQERLLQLAGADLPDRLALSATPDGQ